MPILFQEKIAPDERVAQVYDPDLNPVKGPADAGVSLFFLEGGLGRCYFQSATAGTSSISLQIGQECINDKIDRLALWNWRGGSISSWTRLSKGVNVLCGSLSCRDLVGGGVDFYALAAESLSNRSDDVLEFELAEKLRPALRDTVDRIKGFASLGDNWDSYGAEAIERSTIVKAIRFFSIIVSRLPENAPLPFVAPACDGHIHFEWEMVSKALKHSIPEEENAPWEYLLIDKTSGKIRREPGKALNMKEMTDIALDALEDHATK